jgi:hypothetical protein
MFTLNYDRPDYLDERMKVYDEWIHTAQVRHLNALRMIGTDASTRRAAN